MRGAALIGIALAACADAAPPPSPPIPSPTFKCGRLTYALYADEFTQCAPSDGERRSDERTVDLSTPLDAGIALPNNDVSLQASCDAAAIALTFAASGRRSCLGGCGGGFRAPFTWTGSIRLPNAAPRWRLRVVADGRRVTNDRAHPNTASTTEWCRVELPGRTVRLDALSLEREVDVPAGEIPLTLRCDDPMRSDRGFIESGCYGPSGEQLAREGPVTTVDGRLTLRFEASPIP